MLEKWKARKKDGRKKMYKCGGCSRELKKLEPAKNRCPYCGSRNLYKVRSRIVRTVEAK